MTNIEYFPKFYSKEEIKEKDKIRKMCINELKASGKLTDTEIEELNDMCNVNFRCCADTYTRNYIIRTIKEMQKIVQYR